SPGVWEIPVTTQHAEVVHELGHVIQYQRMPDADGTNWQRYRALRGIADGGIYNAAAPHADRPHEIFAEDFRTLFGGTLAVTAAAIENNQLPSPDGVPGLESFIAALQTTPSMGL